MNDEMIQQAADIEMAYVEFYTAKHPGKDPAPRDFHYFDPSDDVRDPNTGFMRATRELMMSEGNWIVVQGRVLASMRPKPQDAGWYMSIGPTWLFIAPTADDAIKLFQDLTREVTEPR